MFVSSSSFFDDSISSISSLIFASYSALETIVGADARIKLSNNPGSMGSAISRRVASRLPKLVVPPVAKPFTKYSPSKLRMVSCDMFAIFARMNPGCIGSPSTINCRISKSVLPKVSSSAKTNPGGGFRGHHTSTTPGTFKQFAPAAFSRISEHSIVYHNASLEEEEEEEEESLSSAFDPPFAFSLIEAFTNEFNKWSLAYDRFRSVMSSPWYVSFKTFSTLAEFATVNSASSIPPDAAPLVLLCAILLAVVGILPLLSLLLSRRSFSCFTISSFFVSSSFFLSLYIFNGSFPSC
mmetsp:Transcript_3705/g.11441  ORF Transcript_3705/g.11441 Transcript_3705/m.11441 type:complete len:295 (+) Transcript_3705:1265-2149(+)